MNRAVQLFVLGVHDRTHEQAIVKMLEEEKLIPEVNATSSIIKTPITDLCWVGYESVEDMIADCVNKVRDICPRASVEWRVYDMRQVVE
jgi:hypothetical protein